MKRILFSLMTIMLAVGMVRMGAFAYFSDAEGVSATFETGTLEAQVGDPQWSGGEDNLGPGDSASFTVNIKNVGSLSFDYTASPDLGGDLEDVADVSVDPSLGSLDPGHDENVKVTVTLPDDIDGHYGKSGSINVDIDAMQR